MGHLLFTAIQSGFQHVFTMLLSARIRLHSYSNKEGETALYLAARHGRVEMVRALLLAGVDPNEAEAVRGWTPLTVATIQGHHEVGQALVDAAVNQDVCDLDREWIALDHASFKGYTALMKILQRPIQRRARARVQASSATPSLGCNRLTHSSHS